MELSAKIKRIKYKPLLCKNLKSYTFNVLQEALSDSAFILDVGKDNRVAVSWWVSAKRTRSYPYERVYNTLDFCGKKITIIPLIKDEGKDGDRDFLQWDTISLMSLLGIYVIIGYYTDAEKNMHYDHKVTKQRFDTNYIKQKINEILPYQSDALHWNLDQINEIDTYMQKAVESYEKISQRTGVEMHSWKTLEKKVERMRGDKSKFMYESRQSAQEAQEREIYTIQPAEKLTGEKGAVTIENHLGGRYYFTSDEMEIKENDVYLIEGKHSAKALPTDADIKDGLIKMMLFTNLEDTKIGGKSYNAKPVLKLTTGVDFDPAQLKITQKKKLDLLEEEARINNFELQIRIARTGWRKWIPAPPKNC